MEHFYDRENCKDDNVSIDYFYKLKSYSIYYTQMSKLLLLEKYSETLYILANALIDVIMGSMAIMDNDCNDTKKLEQASNLVISRANKVIEASKRLEEYIKMFDKNKIAIDTINIIRGYSEIEEILRQRAETIIKYAAIVLDYYFYILENQFEDEEGKGEKLFEKLDAIKKENGGTLGNFFYQDSLLEYILEADSDIQTFYLKMKDTSNLTNVNSTANAKIKTVDNDSKNDKTSNRTGLIVFSSLVILVIIFTIGFFVTTNDNVNIPTVSIHNWNFVDKADDIEEVKSIADEKDIEQIKLLGKYKADNMYWHFSSETVKNGKNKSLDTYNQKYSYVILRNKNDMILVLEKVDEIHKYKITDFSEEEFTVEMDGEEVKFVKIL